MFRNFKRYLFAGLALFSFCLVGCQNGGDDSSVTSTTEENAITIKINGVPESGVFEYTYTNNTLQLSANVTFAKESFEYTILWSSSRTAVATVDGNGLVTFVGDGEVTIYAKIKDKNISQGAKIKAKNTQSGQVVPTSVSIKNKPAENYLYNSNNSSIQLNAECVLSTGGVGEWELIWSSTNENVVTVNSTGLMQIKADGSSLIKVACKDFQSVCDSFTIVAEKNSLTINNIPTDNTMDLYSSDEVTLSYSSNGELEGNPSWDSSNTSVATIDSTGKITALSIGSTTISLSIAGLTDSFELAVIDTDPAWNDISNVSFDNSIITGSNFFEVSGVKKSNYTFLNESANVGIKISKNNEDNIEGKFHFKSDVDLKANAQYTFSFTFENNANNASSWGSFRLGVKDLLSSVEASGYQPSLYDYCTAGKYRVADEGKAYTGTYVSSEDTFVGKASYTTVTIKFITGDVSYDDIVFELVLNFGANSAEYVITNMKVEETLYSQYAREDLCGILTADSMKHGSASYLMQEATSNFLSIDSDARVGIYFEKVLTSDGRTVNEYSDYEFYTNKKLEANTKYKMTWIVDRYPGHSSAYACLRVGLKDIFRSTEGNFPMSGWDVNNNKVLGLNGVSDCSTAYSEFGNADDGYVFTETVTFTTGDASIDEVIVEVNLNYQSDVGSRCAITKLLIEKVAD